MKNPEKIPAPAPPDTGDGGASAASSCYAPPAERGFYWLRHASPIKGRWQPVAVDVHFGVLGFKKFGWDGWMAVSEAEHAGLEWGGECLCPHNAKSKP